VTQTKLTESNEQPSGKATECEMPQKGKESVKTDENYKSMVQMSKLKGNEMYISFDSLTKPTH